MGTFCGGCVYVCVYVCCGCILWGLVVVMVIRWRDILWCCCDGCVCSGLLSRGGGCVRGFGFVWN